MFGFLKKDKLALPEELQGFKLVVGLGNPGRKYTETRHNIGFMILDQLVTDLNATWNKKLNWRCEQVKTPLGWLMKPITFMNRSGFSVGHFCRYHKLKPEEVLCVYDDTSFELGTVKFKLKGSSGGHNGIKSLIADLGSEEFARLKVGIGKPGQLELPDYVLGKFKDEEQSALEDGLQKAVDAIKLCQKEGFESAANRFNAG